MKTGFLKIAIAVLLVFFVGTGVSSANGWKDRHRTPPGHAYGYYKQKGPPPPVYGPRYAYQKHYHHPVVVERHYYHPPYYYPPVRYVAPAPSGYFFGMSVMEPGMAFSFGVGGR